MSLQASRTAGLRHVRAPVPLHFPEYAEVSEGSVHLIIRLFLYQLLKHTLGPEHSVGSDQFVYWLRTNPKRCLSPDAFVKRGVQQTAFGTWRCWEKGAPDLAVEIISPNEGDGIEWDVKLERYAEMGVDEILRFDPEEPAGKRLRAWDRINEDLVERVLSEEDRTPCLTLKLEWVVRPVETLPVGLRLVDGAGILLASREEAAQAETKAALEKTKAAQAETKAALEETKAARARTSEAEARIRELEEQLRTRT